ncbi:MAG: hypothetical protein ACR2PK_04455 [Acidimicrobiales bacterium]
MSRGSNELEEIMGRLSVHALEHASGLTLVLWGREEPWNVPAAAHPVHYLPDLSDGVTSERPVDSVVSIGQLGNAPHLSALLVELKEYMGPGSVLHFCEPTVARDEPSDSVPQDVTTELWRHGYTVFRCFRERTRYRMRNREFCWGRARITPDDTPPRHWAESSADTTPETS